MRQPRFPVLWFFVLTYVLTLVGQGVHLYVVHRLSAGAAGRPIADSPVWAWMPYGFYVTNVLASSLIIGVAWAFCHWPNFLIPSDPPPWWQFAALVPMGMPASVLYTWVYNSTGGSLFAVVVLHGATVAVPNRAPALDAEVAVLERVIVPLLYALIAIGLVWRYGAAHLSWRGRVVAGVPKPWLHPSGDAVAVSPDSKRVEASAAEEH